MTCTWNETTGLHATDAEWRKHIDTCSECSALFIALTDSGASADTPVGTYYSTAPAVPAGMMDVVMDRVAALNISGVIPARGDVRHRKHHRNQVDSTNHVDRKNQMDRKHRLIPYVAAAAVIIGLGVTFHSPVAQAMTYVIDKIETSFFAGDAKPVPVQVTQVPADQKQQVEQDLLSPAEKSAAEVFAKHRSDIIKTYNQLSVGQTHALRFDDGTAFMVTKQPVFTSFDALKSQSTIPVPVFATAPLGLNFDEGSVRMNGMGTETAEVNMLLTKGGNVKQNRQFEYQKYTDPAFSLGKGNYISINMVFADGVLGTDYIGDFDVKKPVTVQGHSGVLMKYKDTWKPEPGITRLAFGVTEGGHHCMVTIDARGVTPDALLQAAQTIQWVQ